MNTEMKNYAGFSAKELLDDNYFIQSHKERTPESDAFWYELLHSGKLVRAEYEHACLVLEAFGMKTEKISSSGKRNFGTGLRMLTGTLEKCAVYV